MRRLAEGGPSGVALSGGVDSAVVAHLAFAALGTRAYAVTLAGPAVSAEELARSARAVAQIGIAHAVVLSDPLEDDRYDVGSWGLLRCSQGVASGRLVCVMTPPPSRLTPTTGRASSP